MLLLRASAPRAVHRGFAGLSSYRAYSAATSLINVTDIPAPSTGRIRILSLNRPAARNALSRGLLSELRSQIDSVYNEYRTDGSEAPLAASKTFGGAAGVDGKGPTRALIIASEVDSCFCAGADLKERKGMSREETDAFLTNLRSTFTALSVLPIPTISAISSTALGGGLELALCTTLRVLSSTSIIGLPETRLGIIPGAGGTYRLPALIGLSRARDMILTGRRVSGAEAYFLGIADRLVEIDAQAVVDDTSGQDGKAAVLKRAKAEVLKGAVDLATEICMGGPVAVRAALEAVGWAREEVENKCYEKVVGTEDREEALKAFGEKRRPEFKGR